MCIFCFGPDNDGVVAEGPSWVFAGTGLKNGDHIPKLIEREADHFERTFADAGQPRDPDAFARSPVWASAAGRSAGIFSDTTYYTAPERRRGLHTGAPWECKLYDGCPSGSAGPDKNVQRITENVLRVFVAGPAGRSHPSHASATPGGGCLTPVSSAP